MPRKPCPADVNDDDSAFVVPDLPLLRAEVKQRSHDLREVLNAAR